MDKEKIHILIERYFEGDTTLQEEKWLRDNLPSMTGESNEIDEALAVMGYAAARSAPKARERSERRDFRIAAAAACAAILLAAGGIFSYVANSSGQSSFMAYSGGVKLDRQATMQLIAAQMEEMSEASRSIQTDVEDELADFSCVFE